MHERPEFSFDRPFTVSRPGGFTCNGRRYESGDVLDWRELGLCEAEIWDLWVLCQIDNVPAPIAEPAPSATDSELREPVAETMSLVDPASIAGASTPDAARAEDAASTITLNARPVPAATSPPSSAAQPVHAATIRASPSSPPKLVATKGVTKPPHQNQLPRR